MKQTFIVALLFFICHIAIGKTVISLPFVVAGDQIIVKVGTKSNPLNFIFDTGSNRSIVDSLTAIRENLPFKSKIMFSTIGHEPMQAYSTDFQLRDWPSDLRWAIANEDFSINESSVVVNGLVGASALISDYIIEIDFENHIINICDSLNDNDQDFIVCELHACNRSKNSGIGKFFPVFPSIQKNVLFSKADSSKIDLIIDTGSRYGLAFICGDSTMVRIITALKGIYSIFSDSLEICYSEACIHDDIITDSFKSPIFFNSAVTSSLDNSFYGLIGIPALKQYKKVIIDWPDGKIYFEKD